jgi:hypothetical protein
MTAKRSRKPSFLPPVYPLGQPVTRRCPRANLCLAVVIQAPQKAHVLIAHSVHLECQDGSATDSTALSARAVVVLLATCSLPDDTDTRGSPSLRELFASLVGAKTWT